MFKSLIRCVFLIYLFYGFSYANTLKYSVNFFGISAGVITIHLKDKDDVECKGDTKGLFSLFYSYSFYFKQQGNNLFLEEIKNNEKKIYDTKEILQKKAWIPVFINMLTHSNYEVGSSINIGNIKIISEENIQNEIYFFRVEHSHTKRVILWYDKNTHTFPRFIQIETKSGIITFERS